MLLHFGRRHAHNPRVVTSRGLTCEKVPYAILTTHQEGEHAPSAEYLIQVARQIGAKPIIIYPESFRKASKGWVLTIAGKIYSLGNLPFFSVLPVIGAKQQTPFTLNILRQLQSLKVPVLNSAEAIENSDDKLKCYQYLKKQGFENLPVTFDLSQELKPDELAQLPEDVVVKQAQGSSGGDAVWFVKKQELQNYIGPNRLVQERIALETETDSATGQALVVDYRYFVINGKTRMVAKNISAPGEFATNIKKGGTRERVKIDRKMAIIAEDVVNRIGLNWAGVDIGRSIDGKIYVLEVNPTPSMLYGSFPAFHGPRKRLYREILQTVVVLAKGRQKEIKKNLTAIA